MTFTRRHLPHWIPAATPIFVTWRLAGSPPPQAALRFAERQCGAWSPCVQRSNATPAEQSESIRRGPLWLQEAQIADTVANALLYGEAVRRDYELRAWVIMPNHVHVVFEPRVAMPEIMRWLKARTGRVANRLLGRTGKPFWQDESFDHWVRTDQEFQALIEYVENNPLRAGLVPAKQQWRWSSAGWCTGARGELL